MNLRTLLPPLFLLSACVLTEDGTIEATCDELNTCDSIEDGGIVYVEARGDSDAGSLEWRVAVLNGYGETLEEWSGQGEPGPVVYERSTSTVYLAVNDSVRILRDSIPPAIPDIVGMTDAIPVEDGVFFAYKDFVGRILGDSFDKRQALENGTVYHVARPLDPAHFATLLEINGDDAFLLHIGPNPSDAAKWSLTTERLPEVKRNRLFDLFSDGTDYYSCADTGATFLVVPGVGINEQPDRYPNSANFSDLLSCDYRPQTDEVLLVSGTGGIALMNSKSELNFLVDAPTDGWRAVHGSVW